MFNGFIENIAASYPSARSDTIGNPDWFIVCV
jgi:hypothetical protein